MSRDHLRKLGVVKKRSEMKGVWGCMMIWSQLLFVGVGLVPQWVGVQKKTQQCYRCLGPPTFFLTAALSIISLLLGHDNK